MKSCAVTGHRPGKLHMTNEGSARCVRLKQALRRKLSELCEQGVQQFYLGGALGVDLWAGEMLLEMREHEGFPNIQIILALPFEGHDQLWDPNDRKRLAALRDASDHVVIVCGRDKPPAFCYRARNRYLVNHADCLLAVYDSKMSKSGTGMTVRYGEKKGIPIFLLPPEIWRVPK